MATTTIKAHKIRLNPTPEQEEYLRRAAGTRRFVYNWGLAEWKKQYQEYKEGKREKKPTTLALKKQLRFSPSVGSLGQVMDLPQAR